MIKLAWFEIPVINLDRAVKFYNHIFNIEIPILDKRANYGSMVGLLVNQNGIIGTLTQNNRNPYIPSQREGSILYLNVGDEDLNVILSRVEKANGKILLPTTPIEPSGNKGYVAWIMDSEGNRIGLHTKNSKRKIHL